MKETTSFFENILGFIAILYTEGYAIYQKNNLTIHILPAGQDIGQLEFYMEVDDIHNLWASIKDKLTGLKVREPFNQEYGLRELHIGIPETKTLLFIGQEIKV
jgi:hypothetical protein